MADLARQIIKLNAILKRVEGKMDLLLEEQGLEYEPPANVEGPPPRSVLKQMSAPPKSESASEPLPLEEGVEEVEVGVDPLELQEGASFTDRIKDAIDGGKAEEEAEVEESAEEE